MYILSMPSMVKSFEHLKLKLLIPELKSFHTTSVSSIHQQNVLACFVSVFFILTLESSVKRVVTVVDLPNVYGHLEKCLNKGLIRHPHHGQLLST